MALHGEGMVDFRPGRGFSVVPMTRQDVLDLYDAQAYLSGELAARAALHLSGDELAHLSVLQDQLVASIERDDLVETERLDFEMHRLINRSAESPKMTWLLSL